MITGNKRKSGGVWGFLHEKGRIWILLGGILAGVVLLVLGGNLGSIDEEHKGQVAEGTLGEITAYEERLEGELEQLCAAVTGVGHPDVMVRLSGGTQAVYVRDENGTPVTVGSGSNQSALCESLRAPEIAGVGIVCRGGSDPVIRQKLIELVSSTLGIPTSRVYVTGKS